jgi:hypothetical protein
MAVHQLINLISPFSKLATERSHSVTDFEEIDPETGEPKNKKGPILFPATAGIMSHPHDDSAPDGWGDPFNTETGSRTPGGPNSNAQFADYQGSLKASYSPARQGYGNLDWYNDNTIITFWGPPSRYWGHKVFQYGTEDKHWEVYSQGKIIAVAPDPVLGAAKYTASVYNNETATFDNVDYLVVICKGLAADYAYKRPWPTSGVAVDQMDQATRSAMQMYVGNTAPGGWVQIGSIVWSTVTGMSAPDSPYFFSKTGNKAVSMRRIDKEFNNNKATVTEDAYTEIEVDFNPPATSASFTDNGLLIGDYSPFPLEYTEATVKTHAPDYTDPDGHKWRKDNIQIDMSHYGSMVIAADYVGDTKVQLKYWIAGYENFSQYWVIGIDGTGDPTPWNTGELTGYGSGPPVEDDGRPSQWLGAGVDSYFRWDKVQEDGSIDDAEYYQLHVTRVNAGPLWEWLEQPEDPANPFFYFWGRYTRQIHWMDIRHGYYSFSQKEDRWLVYSTTSMNRTELDIEYVVYDPFAADGYTLIHQNTHDPEFYHSSLTGDGTIRMAGWDHATMMTWPENFTENHTVLNYTGEESHFNDGEAVYAPDQRTFWRWWSMPDTPDLREVIQNADCVRNAGWAIEPATGRYAISLEYTQIDGSAAYHNYIYPDFVDMGSLIPYSAGGIRFYPLGIV